MPGEDTITTSATSNVPAARGRPGGRGHPGDSGLPLRRIQFQSLTNYLDGTRTPAQVRQAVTADVRRAARLIDTGLSSFAAFAPGIFAHAPTVQGEA